LILRNISSASTNYYKNKKIASRLLYEGLAVVLWPPQFYMILLNTILASLKHANMSFVAYTFSFSIHLSAIILLHYYLPFSLH